MHKSTSKLPHNTHIAQSRRPASASNHRCHQSPRRNRSQRQPKPPQHAPRRYFTKPYTGPRKSPDELFQLYPTSPIRAVPAHIRKPDYSCLVNPTLAVGDDVTFEIKSAEDILHMREVCAKASHVVEFAGRLVEPGITTDEIDRQVHEEIIRLDCYPSCLHYRGFPKACAISPNNVICHGLPDQRVLQQGDIVNIDVTLYSRAGFHGDCNRMYIVKDCDVDGKQLIDAAYIALTSAINICHDGQQLRAIGREIQHVADQYGYGLCPAFSGHGIGKEFHMAPVILHCANSYPGIMRSGMIFTIEPVLNETPYSEFVHHKDDWTILTVDGARSAQYEQTILITDDGAEILTKH